MSTAQSGGCQCGAVRFRIDGEIDHTSICHCRMCQKATGGIFGVFATARNADLTWTRGAPCYFRSSSLAERGFCRDCGTPLTFVWDDKTTSITFGAFDEPDRLIVDFALDGENAHPALQILHGAIGAFFLGRDGYGAMKNLQHPDHDTHDWPPARTDP